MDIKTTSTRLKELRENAGYSHERLAKALQEKYGISITSASLKKYEVLDEFHSSYGSVKGMKTEYLNMFADFYDVSTDYILGRIDSTSTNVTEQTIYKYFGLDGGALAHLKNLNNVKGERLKKEYFGVPPMLFLNNLLKSITTENFFKHLFAHYIAKENVLQRIEDNPMLKDVASIAFRDVNRYFAINQTEEFIDDFYDRFIEFRQAKETIESPRFQEYMKTPEFEENRKRREKLIKELRERIVYGKKDK